MARPRIQGIYAITNTESGIVYYGMSKDILTRWTQHKRDLFIGRHCNVHLQHAWRRYGARAFIFSIIEEMQGATRHEIAVRELEYILQAPEHLRYNINLELDRVTPHHLSLRHRLNISRAKRGKPFSPEHRKALSLAKLGKPGRQISPEERVKRSQSLRGIKRSPEYIAQMRARMKAKGMPAYVIARAIESRRGQRTPDEVRSKIAATVKASWHEYHSGKPHTDEARAKISATRKAKGIRHSPEVLAQMAETKRRYYAEHPEAREELARRARLGAEKRREAKKAQATTNQPTLFDVQG